MEITLKGRNALVCGASKGIGRAIATQFAEMGAHVTILARNEKELEKAHSGMDTSGGQTHDYIAADLSHPDMAAADVRRKIDDGRIYHILVNNSGGPAPGRAIDGKISEYEAGMRAHLFASQLLARELVPGMKAEAYGRIINIISIGARQPVDNLGVSNTVRGAMRSWSKTISAELGPYGITVNNILPGHTDTERLRSLNNNNAEKEGISVNQFQARLQSKIPAGRFAKPEEPAYLAGFLASDFAAFINGVSIPVDGGFLKCL
jgi:3-oxoacyl-[acyl-carrier protein] reductase